MRNEAPSVLTVIAISLFLWSSCTVPFETKVKNGLMDSLANCYNTSLLLLNYMQVDIKNKLENNRMDREKYRLLLTETETK